MVTIHELDRHQLERPESNKIYNKADAIIVQQQAMKDQLVGLGVEAERIEIVLHGTELPALDPGQPREGVVFYAGHHPWRGKGTHAVFQAMALLKTRLGPEAPRLKMHGYFSPEDLAALKELAGQSGLKDEVVWLNQIPMPEVVRQYGSSQLCLLPFTGSFAGLAAATAAAVELPVIATKHAGIPEHIAENGIWLNSDGAEEIATKVLGFLRSEDVGRDLARRLRRRAERYLTWDAVAKRTLTVFERALQRKMEKNPASRVGWTSEFVRESKLGGACGCRSANGASSPSLACRASMNDSDDDSAATSADCPVLTP